MNNVFPFHLNGGAWKVGLNVKPQAVKGNINWIYILIRRIEGTILTQHRSVDTTGSYLTILKTEAKEANLSGRENISGGLWLGL